jgi:two-component system phosphate regulon response regulator PhoB
MKEDPGHGVSDTFPSNVVLATRRLGEREWFVLRCTHDHASPDAGASQDGVHADLVVPIVLVAADAAQRERIVNDLKAHIEAVVASEGQDHVGGPPLADELRVEHAPPRVTVAGQEVLLSDREFRLLSALVDRRNRAVSREVLLQETGQGPVDRPTRRVDVMVTRLREKLGVAGCFIQSVRGVGYRFVEAPLISAADGAHEAPPGNPSPIAARSSDAGLRKPQPQPSVRMAS